MLFTKSPYNTTNQNLFFDFIKDKTRGSHLFHRIDDLKDLVKLDEDMYGWKDAENHVIGVAIYIPISMVFSEIWLLPFDADADAAWLPDALEWIKNKKIPKTVRFEIPVPEGKSGVREYLEKNSWEYFYTVQSMELKKHPDLLKLPESSICRWEPYTEKHFPSYYQTLVSAFGSRPGISILPYEKQFERCRYFGDKLQLLLDDDEVIGFVRVELHADQTGEIISLARNPSVTGTGLGKIIVSRGIKVLDDLKAKRIVLEVTLNNPQAVRIYQEIGFSPMLAMDTLQLIQEIAV